MKKYTLFLLTPFVLWSCAGEQAGEAETHEEVAPAEATAPTCRYAFNQSAKTEVMWRAYKYTEKTGVNGAFENFVITETGEGTPAEVLSGSVFEINTASSNSGDATRDPKIKESFFGKLENGASITGNVASAAGDDLQGTIQASVTMNGQTHPVDGTYAVNDAGVMELKFELNVETWGGGPAIAELNKVCEDLHKGSDGQSVLWPEVTVFVTTTLDKQCE